MMSCIRKEQILRFQLVSSWSNLVKPTKHCGSWYLRTLRKFCRSTSAFSSASAASTDAVFRHPLLFSGLWSVCQLRHLTAVIICTNFAFSRAPLFQMTRLMLFLWSLSSWLCHRWWTTWIVLWRRWTCESRARGIVWRRTWRRDDRQFSFQTQSNSC